MPSFITGASGFLGGRLAEVLARSGEQVTILARPSSDLRHLSGIDGIRVVLGDLTEGPAISKAARGATHIYHCAAASTDWAHFETYLQSNVTGTETLLTEARQLSGLERFIHISTTDVYGYPQTPSDESGPMVDRGLPYNKTKILAEKAVWHNARKGLPVTVIRPATIYGPRGKDFVKEIGNLLRARQMLLVDGGKKRGGFLYVDNAVDAIISAAHEPRAAGQAYNLSDQTGTTWREYVNKLADTLGYKHPWLNLPFFAAMNVGRSMEFAYRTLRRFNHRPLLTRHAVHLLGGNQEFPADKARREIGFSSRISLDEGIARSAEWFKGTV